MAAGPTASLLDSARDTTGATTVAPLQPAVRPTTPILATVVASPVIRIVLAGVLGRVAGAIGADLVPQGPTSSGSVLSLLAAGLLVGAVAGRMTSSRWGAAVAPLSCLLAVGIRSPLLLALALPIALGALVARAYRRHASGTDVLAAAVAAFCLGLVTVVLLWPVLPAPTLAVDDDGLPALMEMDR
jgi:uncharacterized membrane protein YeaQ/YmgE (transglycosylase-associated protein family)